ncbi:Asp23/Gls24 family envelope stress response protein [Suicoccus acidiformans]|uniref:Asp23/Gls24 family envelope stress response protein n=1 Tax=Suicoccus acidiformans TaxID=2036206 RepID=A0A347WJC9_9LACT|nr:Asp23/Gls24 family envelope stress response protein [Suicoccus acidiformans]AXY25186.1 Asp23/Gls24 family envelope stress response protein [Suicoccus acidiformans]
MTNKREVAFNPSEHGNLGEINITPGVLESIAAKASSEVKGVVTQHTGFQKEVENFLGMDNERISAHVGRDGEDLTIDLHVHIMFGYSVPEVAIEIQERVREQILYMTDLLVSQVNVHVQSIETEAVAGETRES